MHVRTSLALVLCAAALAGVAPSPAVAGTTVQVELLADLAKGTYGGGGQVDSYLGDGPLVSGERSFFISNTDSEDAIFSTSGSPGDVVATTFDPPEFCTDPPNPTDLVSLGDGAVVFQSLAGCTNGQQRRLVITDGSNAPGTTCPVQPQGTCAFAEYTGYYGVSKRIFGSQGELVGEVSTLSPTATEGVVFAAAAVDVVDDAPLYGDYLPWQLTRDGNGDAVVTSLVAGFSYAGPYGSPFEDTDASMVGDLFTTVGNKVFASLLDCGNASNACDGSDRGEELYVLDLSAPSPTWALIGSGLSTDSASTSFVNPGLGYSPVVGVAGGWLFFIATPSGGTPGLYATDGASITPVSLPVPPEGSPESVGELTVRPTAVIGDYLYFSWSESQTSDIWRVSGTTAATPVTGGAGCGGGDLEAVGTTLYFACSRPVDSGDPEAPWNTGLELHALSGAGAVTLTGVPQMIFDHGYAGGAATYPDDDYAGLNPFDLTAVGDWLFMIGYDFASDGDGQALYSYRVGDPAPVAAARFDESELSSEYVYDLAAAGGRLYAWADDGVHGLEPWVGTFSDADQALTVSVSGSGAVASVPSGIQCSDTCEALFPGASTVTLTATAASGWTFAGWIGCTPVPAPASSCTVTMGGPRSVTALFTAAPSLRLLEDLNPDGDSRSVGTCDDAPIRSGGSYYFSVDVGDGQGCQLLASTGEPGGAVLIDLQPANEDSAGDPQPVAALDGGLLLLTGRDGGEWNDEPRLFVSDGTSTGTRPLQPVSLCGVTPVATCGFYGIDARLVTTTSTEGVVFSARSFSGAGDFPAAAHPWRTSDGATVDDLTRGFSYDEAAGLLNDRAGMTAFMVTAVGDVVFADLADCYATGCDDGNEGRELYSLELATPSSTWQLVDGLSQGESATWEFAAFDTASGRLVFTATPDGGLPGLYWTDGDGAQLITDAVFCLSCNYFYPGKTVGDSYFFYGWDGLGAPSFLRYTFDTGRTSAVVEYCGAGDLGSLEPQVVAIGSIVYFACANGGASNDEIYRYVVGGGRARFVYGQTQPPLALRDLSTYGGALYFVGDDPVSGSPALFRYTGDGDPVTIPFGDGPARAEGLRVVGDRFFLWADDGVHGLEPWIGRLAGKVLSVGIVGSGAVTSDPAGIDCPDAGACAVEFPKGQLVRLTATPAEGYSFKGWSTNCTPGDVPTTCTVTLSRDRAVTAFFAQDGDRVAIAGTAPVSVGSGGLVGFALAVSNYSDGDLGNLEIGVTTDLVLLTAGCTVDATAAFDWRCALPTVAAGSARSVTVFARAPQSGTADAVFTVTPAPDGDDLLTNVIGLSVLVVEDVLSLKVSSGPTSVSEGGLLTYALTLRNGTAAPADALATGIVLRAGFDETGLVFPPTGGCTVDAPPAVGYQTSITCLLADLAADTTRAIAFTAYAPSTDVALDLEATFWVSYAEVAGTVRSNDLDGPWIAAVTPISPVGEAAVEQTFDVPIETSTAVTTIPETGLTADDQTGAVLQLPGGFLGTLESADVLETPGPALLSALTRSGGRMGTLARPIKTPPAPFACTVASVYDAECWRFDVSVVQALDVRFVYTFTFRFDGSAFADAGGRLLRIRQVLFFHQEDGATSYTQVPACPRGTTAATYMGTGPCLLSKSVDRATGDYVFVILTDRNGQWKGGR